MALLFGVYCDVGQSTSLIAVFSRLFSSSIHALEFCSKCKFLVLGSKVGWFVTFRLHLVV